MTVSNARVVLVDDDAPTRQFLTMFLTMQGLDIVGEAADGHVGSLLVARLQPAVVVLDLDMPVMDGRAAIPLIREYSPTSHIVVYSLEFGVDARSLRVAAFVSKSSTPEHLATAVLGLVEERAGRGRP